VRCDSFANVYSYSVSITIAFSVFFCIANKFSVAITVSFGDPNFVTVAIDYYISVHFFFWDFFSVNVAYVYADQLFVIYLFSFDDVLSISQHDVLTDNDVVVNPHSNQFFFAHPITICFIVKLYDIQCNSVTGVYPVAISYERYKYTATDLYELWNSISYPNG
jgi:hypothetical protein